MPARASNPPRRRFRWPRLILGAGVSALLALAMAAALFTAPGLARAEEPGRPLAAIPMGARLTGADFRTALAGYTLASTTPNGVRIEVRHGVDGVSAMTSFRTDPPKVIKGGWEAKDGQFCTHWEGYREGQTLCGVVTKTGEKELRIEYVTGGHSVVTVKE